jgi:ribonuclease P protein component
LRTPYFVIYAYYHGKDAIRLGLAVSKAVGIAVVRNRVKRQIRELFRRRKVLVPPGYDLFVRALPASAAASFETLEEAWCTAVGVLTGTEDPGRVGLKNR